MNLLCLFAVCYLTHNVCEHHRRVRPGDGGHPAVVDLWPVTNIIVVTHIDKQREHPALPQIFWGILLQSPDCILTKIVIWWAYFGIIPENRVLVYRYYFKKGSTWNYKIQDLILTLPFGMGFWVPEIFTRLKIDIQGTWHFAVVSYTQVQKLTKNKRFNHISPQQFAVWSVPTVSSSLAFSVYIPKFPLYKGQVNWSSSHHSIVNIMFSKVKWFKTFFYSFEKIKFVIVFYGSAFSDISFPINQEITNYTFVIVCLNFG